MKRWKLRRHTPETSTPAGHDDDLPPLAPNLPSTETQVLHHGRSTMIADISHTLPIKQNQTFLLTAEGGDIVPGDTGQGLYFRDTCFLDQLEVRLNGHSPIVLLSTAAQGHVSVFEVTNSDLTMASQQMLPKERLSLRRSYTITDHVLMTLDLKNLAATAIELDLSLAIASQFRNMFTIRGADQGKRGQVDAPHYEGNTLVLAYAGADGHRRTTTLTFTPPPTHWSTDMVTYPVHLARGDQQHIEVRIDVADQSPEATQEIRSHQHRHAVLQQVLATIPQITSSNVLFDQALQRAFGDLRMLALADQEDTFIAAGIPWYVALFGRDSLITAFECLAFQPDLARSTLLLLARYQGTRNDAFQDEAPGKILHELRVGERANLHEVPQLPYYGTVDATPWFLLLLGEYVRWTGDIALFTQLREAVEAALGWIDRTMQQNPAGFLTYGMASAKGLANQGWKDSGNSIVHRDGSLAQAPIALVEVQGYVYAAKNALAWLYQHVGNQERAQQLTQEATALQQRFEAAFWMDDADFYALALERDQHQVQAIASNAGHTFLTGIVRADRAATVAARLLAPDMYSGWGVRTLSAHENAYNPLDYQVGAVWPHDNALIAFGLARYGLTHPMHQIFTGIFEAATHFRHLRLPEVFDGFSRADYEVPVPYPVACSPQAWAAGTLPLLLQAALGLVPDAPAQTLHIQHPALPPWLVWLEVHGLHVGTAQVDLRYQRDGDQTQVTVLHQSADLTVLVEA